MLNPKIYKKQTLSPKAQTYKTLKNLNRKTQIPKP